MASELKLSHPLGGRQFLLQAGGLAAIIDSVGASLVALRGSGAGQSMPNISFSPADRANSADGSYAGCSLGPYASRVAPGFSIDNTPVPLVPNEGPNSLHGGPNGISGKIFTPEVLPGEALPDWGDGLRLSLFVPDGLDGWPGDRKIIITYLLCPKTGLEIQYLATTTKPTLLNLSCHAYWNLAGDFTQSALDHTLRLNARKVWHNGEGQLPGKLLPVRDSPFDFREPLTLRENLARYPAHPQTTAARGYNHAFMLAGSDREAAAELTADGRTLRVYTDYPALVLNSGGFLPQAGTAIALVAQYPPNGPHLPGNAVPLLRPGELYRHHIRFAPA